ncbi:addiction module protein [Leucothrix pacifica]|uniref:Addiction module antitoxin RelB n=1 Tax=Leucothrix pacifica TaxID=1247513 RepID=A0A317C133_9GAMM|nr:addiction module protein [Leucothrix pacifica]PWQ92345.1 hypothetical protein DKW60_21615 [Leucothrix pacifica]
MEITKIKNMTVLERLQAMESLWSSLINDNVELNSPDWHADVLAERRAKIESGTANFISLDALKAYRKS